MMTNSQLRYTCIDGDPNVIALYKNVGETPSEAILRFRLGADACFDTIQHNLKTNTKTYAQARLTYAGRLDPMAEGLLIILADEAIAQKDVYLNMAKTYEVEVLFGWESDTHDVLGIVARTGGSEAPDVGVSQDAIVSEEAIRAALATEIGVFMQEYPAYSSRTVEGRPLFSYARAGETIPSVTKEVEIFDATLLSLRYVDAQEVLKKSIEKIGLMHGDFRQAQCVESWKESMNEYVRVGAAHGGQHAMRQCALATISVRASSGTYMRSLAMRLGKKLGIGALAYSIKRTKIGHFKIE
jgi:tRNA pseudouridine(55) synthase